ncbi:MAG: hypothetical protein FWF60_05635 [Oscillospiraceae bacterium]|nr:hypothetical protein [Oscillospiraceae bacterium]
MKKARKIICVLAVLTLLLTSLYLWGWHNAAGHLPYASFRKDFFTWQQQGELCDLLQFELAPGESIFTIYIPAMQDEGYLEIFIRGIASREAFLSRLHVEAEPWDEPDHLPEIPWFDLSYDFCEYSTVAIHHDFAVIRIAGPMGVRGPELLNVINSLYPQTDAIWLFFNDHGTQLSYAILYGGIALELGFITTLIILRRKAKKEKPSCQVNPS